jgi:molecular chaperone GrpE
MSKKEEKQVNEFAQTIDRLEDEKLLIENQLKRALADYQNLEKGTQKRIDILEFQSRKNLAVKFLPILDSLTMAMAAKAELKELGESEKSWIDGVAAILENLEKAFDEIGLKKYMPNKGDVFDPSLHEAITTVPDGEKDRIYDLTQPGYMLDDIVIRPARVVVSK